MLNTNFGLNYLIIDALIKHYLSMVITIIFDFLILDLQFFVFFFNLVYSFLLFLMFYLLILLRFLVLILLFFLVFRCI